MGVHSFPVMNPSLLGSGCFNKHLSLIIVVHINIIWLMTYTEGVTFSGSGGLHHDAAANT